MSVGVLLTIVGAAMKIIAAIIGDYYLAKWITAVRVWWRNGAWQSLKEKADEEFRRIESEWEGFQGDRPDGRNPKASRPSDTD